MKTFRILLYIAKTLKVSYEIELPSIDAAIVFACKMLEDGNDYFYDSARIVSVREGAIYQSVLHIEKYSEPSENYGL